MQVKPNRPFARLIAGERIVLWRDTKGKVHCVEDYCPHRGAKLSLGEIHATTIGRIILAHMEPEAVEALVGGADLPASTDKTATSLTQLQAQLAEDRAIGAAWSVGNFEAGIGSCAVVIRDNSSDFAGAINVTGPDHHFSAEEGRRDEIFSAIRAAGKAISTQLGHMSAAQNANRRSL